MPIEPRGSSRVINVTRYLLEQSGNDNTGVRKDARCQLWIAWISNVSPLSLHTVNPNPRQAQGMLALPFI